MAKSLNGRRFCDENHVTCTKFLDSPYVRIWQKIVQLLWHHCMLKYREIVFYYRYKIAVLFETILQKWRSCKTPFDVISIVAFGCRTHLFLHRDLQIKKDVNQERMEKKRQDAADAVSSLPNTIQRHLFPHDIIMPAATYCRWRHVANCCHQVELMQATVQRSYELEESRGGLVIRKALFGKLEGNDLR